MWIEMSRTADHGGGACGFGQCLCSRTKKRRTNDRWTFWENLLRVGAGNRIVHLQGKGDKAAFVEESVAAANGERTGERPPNPGEWRYDNNFYRVRLQAYRPFDELRHELRAEDHLVETDDRRKKLMLARRKAAGLCDELTCRAANRTAIRIGQPRCLPGAVPEHLYAREFAATENELVESEETVSPVMNLLRIVEDDRARREQMLPVQHRLEVGVTLEVREGLLVAAVQPLDPRPIECTDLLDPTCISPLALSLKLGADVRYVGLVF
jgi:hypothetical protein